jgi:hypothetical protein
MSGAQLSQYCLCELLAIVLSNLFILLENSLIADGTSAEEISEPQLGHITVKLGILSPQFGHLSDLSTVIATADTPEEYPHSVQFFDLPFNLLPQFMQKTSFSTFLSADFMLPLLAPFPSYCPWNIPVMQLLHAGIELSKCRCLISISGTYHNQYLPNTQIIKTTDWTGERFFSIKYFALCR